MGIPLGAGIVSHAVAEDEEAAFFILTSKKEVTAALAGRLMMGL